MIIGIDNGLDGGIVALSPLAGLPPIAKHTMPTMMHTYPARKKTPVKSSREIYTRGLVALLGGLECNREETSVFFEHCPFHADQALTMRSMAMSAGKILAVLEAMGFRRIHRVLSFDWHPVMLGKIPQGQSKTLALAKATELWPEENWLASKASKVPHNGLIDAALIAEYGRRLTYPPMAQTTDTTGESPW
jgi:hypothetical protein